MRLGILPVARATFDVDYAQTIYRAMSAALAHTGHDLIGPKELLFDPDETQLALTKLAENSLDALLILQVTFTDAQIASQAGEIFDGPLYFWAAPEPRLGGRLRLNAFCGLNLASHALGLRHRDFGYLYANPDAPETLESLAQLLEGKHGCKPATARRSPVKEEVRKAGKELAASLSGVKIAQIGDPPDGFDSCYYDRDQLKDIFGVSVDTLELDHLFSRAGQVSPDQVTEIEATVMEKSTGLADLDAQAVDRSLRLFAGLQDIKKDQNCAAMAVRCWPECFTEFGGAVCGPLSMMGEGMGEKAVPCACEADVNGALTQIILQRVSGQAVFMTDLVDVDLKDDTAVVWHCGQAPLSMANPVQLPETTVHSNRKLPLLFQFALKPGPVTFMRISRAYGQLQMILAYGEMLDRPAPFTGTCGTVRYEGGAESLLEQIFNSGIEHHMALAYGDHRDMLKSIAAAFDLPVQELTGPVETRIYDNA